MVATIREELRARARHPFMVEHPEGWDGIVQRLHDRLVELVPDYQVFQTKEKFGGLRFYIQPLQDVDKELWVQVHQAINEAEAESYKTCENCGQPGELRRDYSWVRTLCNRCEALREGQDILTWEDEGGLATED